MVLICAPYRPSRPNAVALSLVHRYLPVDHDEAKSRCQPFWLIKCRLIGDSFRVEQDQICSRADSDQATLREDAYALGGPGGEMSDHVGDSLEVEIARIMAEETRECAVRLPMSIFSSRERGQVAHSWMSLLPVQYGVTPCAMLFIHHHLPYILLVADVHQAARRQAILAQYIEEDPDRWL